MIGLHYFRWLDQAINGRRDSENYKIGFMGIGCRLYPELMESARSSHERLYRVAAGELAPTDRKPHRAQQVFY